MIHQADAFGQFALDQAAAQFVDQWAGHRRHHGAELDDRADDRVLSSASAGRKRVRRTG
jgi:hypothetical protein